MEAVATHAVGRVFAGMAKLRHGRLGPMEGRIEADDLRQVGPERLKRADRRQVVRLVQASGTNSSSSPRSKASVTRMGAA